jgi:hypothetical protein
VRHPLRVARSFLVHDTKTGKNVPNEHKMHQIVIKYTNWPQRPNGNKIYPPIPLQDLPKMLPNWDFWFENIPSGNPAST